MADLSETPRGNRIRIAFFGLRNAGKSTLVNAFAGQPVAIVSDVAGTTTDPVSKAMEILPLGPCLVTDTAGLDDAGELGELRVEQSLRVLDATDIAVWVEGSEAADEIRAREIRARFQDACARRGVTVFRHRRGDSVEELKRKIAAVKLEEPAPGLLDGLVKPGDRLLCVCPIDESAPKGRLILPQVQVIREGLDRGVTVTVCQTGELLGFLRWGLSGLQGRLLVVADSQAFGPVARTLQLAKVRNVKLTSFSVLFARQKGDLGAYVRGLEAIGRLQDGDTVLVAEGCTHHRQCNDIGTVRIPQAMEKLSGRKLKFEFASGGQFELSRAALVVHCGGCMLTRREMLRRIARAEAAGVPIVNYGLVLAKANGIDVQSIIL